MLSSNQPVFSDWSDLKTAQELARTGDLVVLGYDCKVRQIRAGKGVVAYAGRLATVRVTTDKGVFDLSTCQRVRLSSGGYVKAGDLNPGISLHAVTVDLAEGYSRVHLQDGKSGKRHFHRMAAEISGHDIHGKSVHHRDENKLNNRPENLEVITQSQHSYHHGKKLAATGKHIFQIRTFSKSGDKNGMHGGSAFWGNAEKANLYRDTQRRILTSSGRASDMQTEAAKQKRCNGAFKILNAGHKIDTFEEYYEGFKAVIGRVAHGKAVIRASIDKAFGSFDQFVQEVSRRNHRVVAVEELGVADVYAVFVPSSNPGDPAEADGNLLIMSVDATSQVGRGILVAGSPGDPGHSRKSDPDRTPLAGSHSTTRHRCTSQTPVQQQNANNQHHEDIK